MRDEGLAQEKLAIAVHAITAAINTLVVRFREAGTDGCEYPQCFFFGSPFLLCFFIKNYLGWSFRTWGKK